MMHAINSAIEMAYEIDKYMQFIWYEYMEDEHETAENPNVDFNPMRLWHLLKLR